jgi:hypothetical protein
MVFPSILTRTLAKIFWPVYDIDSFVNVFFDQPTENQGANVLGARWASFRAAVKGFI